MGKCKKGYHQHWVFGDKWQTNECHPIKQKHKHPDSQLRHDMATGKFQNWVERNNLRLTDATYEKYMREVING